MAKPKVISVAIQNHPEIMHYHGGQFCAEGKGKVSAQVGECRQTLHFTSTANI